MVHRNEYRRRLAAISNYMQKFRVPGLVQDRVKLWLQYTWEHQKIFDENKVLSFLQDSPNIGYCEGFLRNTTDCLTTISVVD